MRSRGNVEVALPDDADALEIICLVLHHQNEAKVYSVSLETLDNIAELADKYDLGIALKPVAELWINKFFQKKDPRERFELLLAAYLLR